MDTETTYQLGIWAQRRLCYLKEHRSVAYTNLLTTDALDTHLQEVDVRAEELTERLTSEMAKRESVTEKMKAIDQMTWVQAMGNIQARVREAVNSDIIFA